MKFFGTGTWKPGKRIYAFYRIFGAVFLILGLIFCGMIIFQSLGNSSEYISVPACSNPSNPLKMSANESDDCYSGIAIGLNNASFCDKIGDENLKDNCYINVAVNLNNSSPCDKIESQNMKELCYLSVANGGYNTVDMYSSFKQVTCNGGDTLIRIFPGYTLSRLTTKEIPNLLKFKSEGIIEDFYQVPLYDETMNKTFIENYFNLENSLMESGNGTEPLHYEKNYVFLIISKVETANSSPLYEKMSQDGYTDYSFSTISIVPENYEESQVISYSCKIQ
jgi:hypothetical protein